MGRRIGVCKGFVVATCLGLALGVRPPASNAAGLLAHWSFDDCTGADSSGNSTDLTLGGTPTCETGRFGNGFTLDGTTEYLERSPDATFTPAGRPWTVAAWIKTTTDSVDLRVVVSWYRCGANAGCTTSDPDDYVLGLLNGHAYWDVRNDFGEDASISDPGPALNDGNWHFLVGTGNSSVNPPRLYVDGALRAEGAAQAANLVAGSVTIPLEVGRMFRQGWGVPGNYFPGSIDEVRIYDTELSARAIEALFTGNVETRVRPASWGAIKNLYR